MGAFASAGSLAEDINLEFVPLPVFPLPSKPFPVQPPTKIGTGFAPVIPLDKSDKKVRHWRIAHREIRGIAGGRWFVRSWVGEKESEYASAVASATALTKDGDKQSVSGGVALPKLSAVSISAPSSGKGRSKTSKSSLAGSAIPSRAGSAIPDHAAPTRAPTKMRTMLSLAPQSEEGNDSDMVAPPGP
jgi:Wiskott-Aldrich syndrome protein